MAPLAVVKDFEVFPEGSFGLGPGFIASVIHPFGFKAAPEAL